VCTLLPKRLAPVTARTVTRRADLLDVLADIRRSGLAHEREEVSAGLTCFAAFVGVTALGKRVAVSTSLPLERIDAKREKRIAIAIVEMAHRLGKAL
jgi:DNA-binding IclR family transcriptional regulator